VAIVADDFRIPDALAARPPKRRVFIPAEDSPWS
jgi:hypothetical protein